MADMSDERPLPEPYFGLARRDGGTDKAGPWFTADQMRAYLSEGTASLKAENERLRAKVASTCAALNVSWQLRDTLATQLRACERGRDNLRDVLRKTKTCALPTEVRELVCAALISTTPGKE